MESIGSTGLTSDQIFELALEVALNRQMVVDQEKRYRESELRFIACMEALNLQEINMERWNVKMNFLIVERENEKFVHLGAIFPPF